MNNPVICGIEDATDAGVADVARELADRYEVPLLYMHVLDGAGEIEQAVRMLRNACPRIRRAGDREGPSSGRSVGRGG